MFFIYMVLLSPLLSKATAPLYTAKLYCLVKVYFVCPSWQVEVVLVVGCFSASCFSADNLKNMKHLVLPSACFVMAFRHVFTVRIDSHFKKKKMWKWNDQ